MVRATIEIDEDVFERLRRAANDRGITVEAFISDQVRQLPAAPEAPDKAAADASPNPVQQWFDRIDGMNLKPSGWKWNRNEIYDRKVLR